MNLRRIAASMGLAVAIWLYATRTSAAGPITYGLAGGAVCPKCGLPFSRSVFGLNLLVGKLSRCPHCGKWSVVGRASPEELAAAEAKLRGEKQPAPPAVDAATQLHKRIEESRYE
jgi:hypothetical protein